MANNTPVGNIDFISPLEGMSALQRNPQVAAVAYSFSAGAGLSSSFSGSTIYAVFVDSGNVIIQATSNQPNYSYKVIGGTTPPVFPFGLPTGYSPPGGPCTFLVSSSTVVCTIVYK